MRHQRSSDTDRSAWTTGGIDTATSSRLKGRYKRGNDTRVLDPAAVVVFFCETGESDALTSRITQDKGQVRATSTTQTLVAKSLPTPMIWSLPSKILRASSGSSLRSATESGISALDFRRSPVRNSELCR